MMTANSSTGPTRKFLMLQDQRMKKAKLLVLLETMEEQIKNGKSFILIKLKRQRPRVLMQNSVSTLTDLSTLFHNFHSTELPKCLEEPTLFSRDGGRTLDNNNSGLMKFQRLSETTTGRTTASISRATETAVT